MVIDHERLCIDLQRDLPSTAQIVPLPKSGGVSLGIGRRASDSATAQVGRGKSGYWETCLR